MNSELKYWLGQREVLYSLLRDKQKLKEELASKSIIGRLKRLFGWAGKVDGVSGVSDMNDIDRSVVDVLGIHGHTKIRKGVAGRIKVVDCVAEIEGVFGVEVLKVNEIIMNDRFFVYGLVVVVDGRELYRSMIDVRSFYFVEG